MVWLLLLLRADWPRGGAMKVTLDLSKLVEQGQLTAAEADRLKGLAATETGSLGINILVGFGVVAVAAGAVALVPTPLTAIVLGAVLFGAGMLLSGRAPHWAMLGTICLVLGALMFSGGVIAFGEGSLPAMLIVTAALTVGALAARSSLLIALAVLAASACLGAHTGYWHATYSLSIMEPLLTIVLFSALALGAYLASHNLTADYERLAIAASRTSLILINFGFWIGSLWGDRLLLLRQLNGADISTTLMRSVIIPDWAFSIAWALALIAVGVWGVKANRRWVVNLAAIFGAIHFYTQWFERLGANPLSILLGGLLMLGFALGLWAFNRKMEPASA
jgi:hypothetical protein